MSDVIDAQSLTKPWALSEPTEVLGLDIVVRWGGETQLSEERLGTVQRALASRPSQPVAGMWLVGPGR